MLWIGLWLEQKPFYQHGRGSQRTRPSNHVSGCCRDFCILAFYFDAFSELQKLGDTVWRILTILFILRYLFCYSRTCISLNTHKPYAAVLRYHQHSPAVTDRSEGPFRQQRPSPRSLPLTIFTSHLLCNIIFNLEWEPLNFPGLSSTESFRFPSQVY